MKIKDVIAYVDAIKPNAFPDEVKVQWINEVEGFIQTDVMLLDILELIRYSFPDDYETELLVLPPHSKIYYAYLTAMVDFANGEYNKYANTMQIYNTFLGEYMEWYTMKYRPADGMAVAHGYYISAYGIAVKHGYGGSEEQWIESLKGEKGEPFRYEDFTKEQLELLRGPAGESIKSIKTTDIEQPDGSIRHVVEVTTTKGQIERFYVDDGKNYILTEADRDEIADRAVVKALYTAEWGSVTVAELDEAYHAGKTLQLRNADRQIAHLQMAEPGSVYDFVLPLNRGSVEGGVDTSSEITIRVYRVSISGDTISTYSAPNARGNGYVATSVQKLTQEQQAQALANMGTEGVYTAQYGVTTFAEINEAMNAGKKIFLSVPGGHTVPLSRGVAGFTYMFIQLLSAAAWNQGESAPEEMEAVVRIYRITNSGKWEFALYELNSGGDGGGISKETDPTVPAWAKEPVKPEYTADEVGALPATTKIPAKTSDLQNDSGFITKAVTDLANYYAKSQTYNRDEINERISAIPKFAISVVSALPTTGISTTTIYLVKSGSGADLYTEYIYTSGAWEILGSQRVDLTGYATEAWVNAKIADFLTADKLTAAMVTGALGFTPAKDTDVPAVDSTLKVSGAAADAKAVGDKVNQLSEAIADKSMWTGKRFVAFGTSLTSNDQNYDVTYLDIVAKRNGFTSYTNASVSGSQMVDASYDSLCIRKTIQNTDMSGYDLVLIECGTNDFFGNYPIGSVGEMGDTVFDTATFCGALRASIEYIFKAYPTKRIMLITPPKRDKAGYNINTINGAGHKLIDYVDAMWEVSALYSIPVCDWYRCSGINDLTLSVYTTDGLHPNADGYVLLGDLTAAAVSAMNCSAPIIIKYVSDSDENTDTSITYGVEWDYSKSSTQLTRLGSAAGFGVPAPATSLSETGSSPFDNIMPWAGLKRYNIIDGVVSYSEDDTGFDESAYDTVVYIPEFWFKAVKDTANSKWQWYISGAEVDGYTKHPGSGRYVGRYHTGVKEGVYGSFGGITPKTSESLASFRTNSHAKGDNWWQMDIATWSALQMLYIVEFADWYSQSTLGTGHNTGNGGATGGTNGAVYHTYKASSANNMYRWVENPFSNLFTWCDGVVSAERAIYISTDNANFTDTASGMTATGITVPTSNLIRGFGYSEVCPWAFIPDTASGSDYTTYVTDRLLSNNGTICLCVGGDGVNNVNYGMFDFSVYFTATAGQGNCGSRLVYIP